MKGGQPASQRGVKRSAGMCHYLSRRPNSTGLKLILEFVSRTPRSMGSRDTPWRAKPPVVVLDRINQVRPRLMCCTFIFVDLIPYGVVRWDRRWVSPPFSPHSLARTHTHAHTHTEKRQTRWWLCVAHTILIPPTTHTHTPMHTHTHTYLGIQCTDDDLATTWSDQLCRAGTGPREEAQGVVWR
jgi:hypothetical protein